MNIKACIFARGGSKGLPGKNIRLLAGKPLIGWAIESVLGVNGVEDVFVSTDSLEIAEIAKEYGACIPFIRPTEISGDKIPEWDAWRHLLNFFQEQDGEFPNAILSVPATAPLREVVDLQNCVDLYSEGDCDSVITITESHRNPFFNMVALDHESVARIVNSSDSGLSRRQDAPKVYDITTVAYVVRSDFIMNQSSLFAGRVKSVYVPIERSIDIDSLLDFEIAEFLIKKKLR